MNKPTKQLRMIHIGYHISNVYHLSPDTLKIAVRADVDYIQGTSLDDFEHKIVLCDNDVVILSFLQQPVKS